MTLSKARVNFLFLNAGHFLDHFFLLIFATVAALSLAEEWGMSYAELIAYSTPGFFAFGVCSLPAGWLADRWSKEGMLAVFFTGIGLASILVGTVSTPLQLGLCLTALGVLAAIYHPVGLAMVIQGRGKPGMALAVNGIYGNLGVACAALVTGLFLDALGWRWAFFVPGALSVAIGIGYWLFVRSSRVEDLYLHDSAAKHSDRKIAGLRGATVARVFGVVLFTTAVGGLIFQSTTFALPKIFDERLAGIASTASEVGGWAFAVLAVAGFAQLVIGYAVDRMSIPLLLGMVFGGQALLFWAMADIAGYAAVAVAVCFMLLVFGQIPINDVLISRVIRPEWRSRAIALRSAVTFTVLATAVPLIAWIHFNWGFPALFVVLAVASAFSFAAVLVIRGVAEIGSRKLAES